MIESVGWNWNDVTDSYWLNPCEESYYYAVNWKKAGCKSVLDLGCGLGRHSILFAKSGYKVTACDISKDAWSFTEGNFPKIDENSILKTEGAEVNVPHFYVNKEDILRLLPDFEIHSIRHIDDCYHDGKFGKGCHYYISATLEKTASEPDFSSVIGREVSGQIDRPLGTAHPRHPEMIYPINYGFVNGVFAADGAEQDIYLFNENKPVKTFTGKVIAVYHRFNDVEDKWIVSADGSDVPDEEILKQIEFQEKYFDGRLYR